MLLRGRTRKDVLVQQMWKKLCFPWVGTDSPPVASCQSHWTNIYCCEWCWQVKTKVKMKRYLVTIKVWTTQGTFTFQEMICYRMETSAKWIKWWHQSSSAGRTVLPREDHRSTDQKLRRPLSSTKTAKGWRLGAVGWSIKKDHEWSAARHFEEVEVTHCR